MSNSEELRRHDLEFARRQQREASERARKSQDLGRWFHYGMAELRGETRENGWLHEQPLKLASGRERIHDTALLVNEIGGRDFTEYKWGENVGGEFTMEQIAKEREVLQQDPNARGTWVLQQGAADSATRKELDALVRDFPGRFFVEEITKEQANKALEVGKDLERNRDQLELVNTRDLRRQQRIKERRERLREKERTQEAAQRAVEQQKRERQTREAQQKQREAAERLAEHIRREREAAARGQILPMTGREAADLLAVSRPTPGIASPHREPPRAGSTRGGRERSDRERGMQRER